MKPSFSEPKIYTGGIDPKKWSSLSKKQQKEALEKDWYVRWSFRDPESGKLKRQPNIKAGANRLKTKRERLSYLKTLQRNLHWLLERGFNPYKNNAELIKQHFPELVDNQESNGTLLKENHPQQKNLVKKETNKKEQNTPYLPPILAQNIILDCLRFKKNTLTPTSYSRFKSKIGQFSKWLTIVHGGDLGVSELEKSLVMSYLDSVLEKTSARNRNNAKADLSALFQYLEDHGHIRNNFVKGIKNLPTKPNLNRSYTPEQLQEIEGYLKEKDPMLLLFARFISYGFLRPVEICRLKVGNIDIKNRMVTVQTKTKKTAVKRLPGILIDELPPLGNLDAKNPLFTPYGLGGVWDTSEENKRDYFSKRFKKVKDTLGYGKEYGLYSFRHTYITKLYRKLRKEYTPFVAKSKLMTITGHRTMDALEKYLRDINAEIPDDYSHLFEG